MSDPGPFDGPRDFSYITPMGRRLSDYEALNLFVFPLETSMASGRTRVMAATVVSRNATVQESTGFIGRLPSSGGGAS